MTAAIRLLAVLCCLALPFAASAQSMPLDLPLGNRTSPAELAVEQQGFADGRLTLDLTLTAPSLLADLDAELNARGRLYDSGLLDLKWRGPTEFLRSEPSGRIVLKSRVAIKYAGSWDGKGIEIHVDPIWDAAMLTLKAKITLANINNFPNKIEDVLKDLGISFERSTALLSLAEGPLATAEPQITFGQASATADGRGLIVPFRLSFSGEQAVSAFIDSLRNGTAGLLPGLFGTPAP